MHPGAVEVVAYQETLMLMAIFAVAILGMAWAGFRRWLQHKERLEQLLAKEIAERSIRRDAQMDRVEARLSGIERTLIGSAPAQMTQSSATPMITGTLAGAGK